ncbi:LysR family transcriptional regulator [Lactobacillus hamsteri]|uniref:LysR family transcriptional regulator n=1 Tax=Lactobacillus hamsteri DSM 5661 = JCM 6256 TaxID=1423754 RepID=A0A0R1YE39_9LACO|nr:LysR family transcriptional regulator [Lactobacillus hamsteri]KRM38155.1 LysR family transcriptional regulator [Lactobacillus hamsteri DSM 5661 = JCM 6256]
MNLTGLKYFVSVASLGSVTEAAKAAYVSESAISKTIKQLENEIGVQLFDRQGRTIKLNKQGKIFYSYVSDSLKLLNSGITAVQSDKNLANEQINVLFTVGSPLISSIALKMQDILPNVSLNIRQKTTFAKDFKQFDFIISSKKIDHFTAIPLLKEELLIGWKKNFLHTKHFLQAQDLEKYTFVGESDETELQTLVNNFLLQNNIKLNFKYQSDEPATVRQMIVAGLGAGFIPKVTWGRNFANYDLIDTARIVPTPPYRTIYLNTPHKKLNDNQRLFSNEIANVFVQAQKNN